MKTLLSIAAWFLLCVGFLSYSLYRLVSFEAQAYDPYNQTYRNNGIIFELIDKIGYGNTNSEYKPNVDNIKDVRVFALRKFFKQYNSPLYDYAEVLVAEADRWGLDYALLPAIAMQESSGCKVMPYESYNCWGYGIYGEKVVRFNSYPEAISKVAQTLKKSYISEDLTNPTLLEDRWTPSSKGHWSYSVNLFMSRIHDLES